MTTRTGNFILVGIIAGLALALLGVMVLGEAMARVEWLGTLFLRALKMIIVPLVMSSMIVGIAGLGDVRKLGRVGLFTLAYYVVTTAVAVAIGMAMVSALQPGVGLDLGETAVPDAVVGRAQIGFQDIVLSFVSENIVQSMAELDLLPVILFSLVLGGVLTTLGERGAIVIQMVEGLNEAIMKIVHLLMLAAPVGVFGLVAGRFARAGDLGELIGGLGMFVGTVLAGLAVHAFLVLPAILWVFGRRNPLRFGLNMAPALLTAFSTASSSATLPLTIEGVQENNGISRRTAYFVIPLGATVNMNGTALYEAVAAIFIAQVIGADLAFGQQMLILITATLAAIGAAGIPEAGLVTMAIVLKAVGLPLEGIGLILAVDWLLDRFRTAVNVWGDACGAGVIEHQLPAVMAEPEEER